MAGTDGTFLLAGDRFLIAKYALVGAAGVGQEDGDDKGPVSGYWILDPGSWILDAGYWILDTGCWMLVPAC